MGTLCGACMGPAREYSMFFISYRTHTGPVRNQQGCCMAPLLTHKGIDKNRIGKNPARVWYLAVRARTGPLRSPHGLFTGCLQSINPYGARKVIIHALKLYGPRTGNQNGRRFPDDIFKCIFLTENVWILNKIWLQFFAKGPFDNATALVQIMAWCRSGDKPLSELMMG